MLTNGPNIYQVARKESCLTQEQAAERLEVSETTVKAWEQGARVPDNETVAPGWRSCMKRRGWHWST